MREWRVGALMEVQYTQDIMNGAANTHANIPFLLEIQSWHTASSIYKFLTIINKILTTVLKRQSSNFVLENNIIQHNKRHHSESQRGMGKIEAAEADIS